MSQHCNNLCLRIKVSLNRYAGLRSTRGNVRCSTCKCFIPKIKCEKGKNGRLLCSCCHSGVSLRPRNKREREIVLGGIKRY